MTGKEITTISPEGVEIANAYLTWGNIPAVCKQLGIPSTEVVSTLNKREVKKYIDTVYLDTGYRNRANLASVMDSIIASKLEEAELSEVFTKKDLVDVIALAHKMRMDEIKALGEQDKQSAIKRQTNIQINNDSTFGGANWENLVSKILSSEDEG